MDDSALVSRSEAISDLLGVVHETGLRKRLGFHYVAQGLAFEEFGDQVGSAFKSSQLMDREDVRMV